MRIRTSVVLTAMVATLTGCGGGSSDSGGGSTELERFRFSGTYDSGPYQGSIQIDIVGGVPTVTLTNLPCLQAPFSAGLSYEVVGATANVAGNITGQPASRSGPPADFGASFPNSGGAGRLNLDPGAPCFSGVGSLTVTRTNI